MRTTIDLDEELLRTVKAIAEVRGETLSRVITDLAWKGLRPDRDDRLTRNGFPLMQVRAGAPPVTPEHVAELVDQVDSGVDAGL